MNPFSWLRTGWQRLSLRGVGRKGERLAERHLRQQGFKILFRNLRNPCGEMDLVAQRGELLLFCEVKARRGEKLGSPGEAIHADKQARLVRLAEGFLQHHPHMSGMVCRYDAILIRHDADGWQLEWLEDAFRPGW